VVFPQTKLLYFIAMQTYKERKNPIVTRLTVPVTSASAERSFSKLKSVKTVMRSVMNQERLS
jgi:ERCC4-type nuclease